MNLESGMGQSVCGLLMYSQARFYAAAASFETTTTRPSVYFHQANLNEKRILA